MKTNKQVQREARHLFRLCMVNGSLDTWRVRQVIQSLLGCKRHGYLALVNKFERLVRLDQNQPTAGAESAMSAANVQTNVDESFVRRYGLRRSAAFAERPTTGGGRVRVSGDVYDGSAEGRLVRAGKKH